MYTKKGAACDPGHSKNILKEKCGKFVGFCMVRLVCHYWALEGKFMVYFRALDTADVAS